MSSQPGTPSIRPRLLVPAGVASALVLAMLASWAPVRDADATAARHAIGPGTRFDHVAVFSPGTPAAAIEGWRQTVLAHAHVQACATGRACLVRALRLSALGAAGAEVLAFDLAADTPPTERHALLAAALTAQPRARLCHACTPLQATAQ